MAANKRYEFTVLVKTQFNADQSDIELNRYVFAYFVTILNTGTMGAQLISRHWTITDAHNEVSEVRGLGVVGAQPFLQPGEKFEYSSGSVLKTPSGNMFGVYFMTAEDGTQFEADVELFQLQMPRVLH